MFDFGIFSTIIQYATQNPQLAAGIMGVMLSLAATQVLKYLVPASWTDTEYKSTVRVIGIVSGWFFGFGAWKLLDPTERTIGDFFWAAGVGFLSPAIYSLLTALIGIKWPAIEKYVSGRPDGSNP
jgi:hypothetical protein